MTSGRLAIVLLSGGLDSATVLAMARRDGFACHALSFAYGQRHDSELRAAARIAAAMGAVAHDVIELDRRAHLGSALTDAAIAVPEGPAAEAAGIPATYVPARNTVFLAHALGIAEVRGARDIFIGVNAVDYSGYPDCRPAFIAAFEVVANLATRAGVEGRKLTVHAPLIAMTKAQIVAAGVELGVDHAMTVSCYQADDLGRACGRCAACGIRRQGFAHAGVADPTRYQ